MNEPSIALDILKAAEDEAARLNVRHIAAVHLNVGTLSGVMPAVLQRSYEAISAGTVLDGSRLEIEKVPVVIFCSHCRDEQLIESIRFLRCATCGASSGEIVGGRELELIGFEVEALQTT